MKNFWKIDKFWEKITWPHRSVRLLGFLVNGRKCSAILFFFSNKNSWFWNMQFSGLIFCDWSAAWESNWCVFSFNRLQCIFSHFLKHEIQCFFNFSLLQQPRIEHEKNVPRAEFFHCKQLLWPIIREKQMATKKNSSREGRDKIISC